MSPTQAQRIEALEARFAAMEKRQDDADVMRVDTHKMVADMHRALMEPQIGQGDKSLVERMAAVTVDIESGKRTADGLLSVAKLLVGVAAAVAALAAMVKFGVVKG